MRTSAAVMAMLATLVLAATATARPSSSSVVVFSSKPAAAAYDDHDHDCAGDDAACSDPGLPTFRPYSQHELDKLLEQRLAQLATVNGGGKRPTNKLADLYVDNDNHDDEVDDNEANAPVVNVLEQSKSHDNHHHNHDHDDDARRKEAGGGGWVTLEPVPWAHSHIQKWEPHAKPQIPFWESGGGGGGGADHSRPGPVAWTEQEYRPQHRPHQQQYQQQYQYEYKPWTSSPARPEIVTDDRPARFPTTPPWPAATSDHQSYSAAPPLRPQAAEGRPRPGHGDGGGQWVLLSSTKGYSAPAPHRQRSLRSDAGQVSVSATLLSGRRTVRLTVLPPADNSTGTRLSHGGLLEVESSGQTVEESQREHAAKMLRLTRPHDDDNEVKPSKGDAVRHVGGGARRSGGGVQVYATGARAFDDRSAVLAALGAGALPATVAVLLPMVLGRRRRRHAASYNKTAVDHRY